MLALPKPSRRLRRPQTLHNPNRTRPSPDPTDAQGAKVRATKARGSARTRRRSGSGQTTTTPNSPPGSASRGRQNPGATGINSGMALTAPRPPRRRRVEHQNKRERLCPGRPKGANIILLSAFDGVGAAPFIVDENFGRPRLAIACKIDKACVRVLKERLPWVCNRGDITAESAKEVAKLVQEADHRASVSSYGRGHHLVSISPSSPLAWDTRAIEGDSSLHPHSS